MENAEEPVQNKKKKRSQSGKVGRHKWNQQLLKQVLEEAEQIRRMQRTILAGLKEFFHFEKPLMEEAICRDEVDSEILPLLFEAGSPGLLPKDLAAKLKRFKVTRHQISRRILRMNNRLEKEFGEQVAEKRGWHWALTGFVREAWGETEKEFDA